MSETYGDSQTIVLIEADGVGGKRSGVRGRRGCGCIRDFAEARWRGAARTRWPLQLVVGNPLRWGSMLTLLVGRGVAETRAQRQGLVPNSERRTLTRMVIGRNTAVGQRCGAGD